MHRKVHLQFTTFLSPINNDIFHFQYFSRIGVRSSEPVPMPARNMTASNAFIFEIATQKVGNLFPIMTSHACAVDYNHLQLCLLIPFINLT